MIYKVSEMTRDELLALARNGKSPQSRWLASRELRVRGVAA